MVRVLAMDWSAEACTKTHTLAHSHTHKLISLQPVRRSVWWIGQPSEGRREKSKLENEQNSSCAIAYSLPSTSFHFPTSLIPCLPPPPSNLSLLSSLSIITASALLVFWFSFPFFLSFFIKSPWLLVLSICKCAVGTQMMHTCSHTPTTLCVVISKPLFDVDFDSQQEEQGSLKITSVYHLLFLFLFLLGKKSQSVHS